MAGLLGPARWRLTEDAQTPRLGERNEIIKRIHQGLTEQGIKRSIGDVSVHDAPDQWASCAYGLDDELKKGWRSD